MTTALEIRIQNMPVVFRPHWLGRGLHVARVRRPEGEQVCDHQPAVAQLPRAAADCVDNDPTVERQHGDEREKMTATAKVTALAPWYGSNRMLASEVGKQLDGCNWVGIPFAGGMCEVAHIKARTLLIGDTHRHIINLACVASDPKLGPQLYRRLRRTAFHPEIISRA